MLFFRKSKMKTLKDNVKVLQKRNKDLYERDLERQHQNLELRKEICRLKLELEDTQGFLEQEKQCSDALRKEIKSLKYKPRKNTKEKKNGEKVLH